jgi:hydrogenase expression/formation protein HypE
MISVVKEGVIGGRLGATAMHDVTEGGLLGAVWEIAESSGVGFELYDESIPITKDTAEICGILGINPLKLISSGMMVMTTHDRDLLVDTLKENGINAACIGRIVANKGRRVLISDRTEERVSPPEADELFNIKVDKPCK